MFIQAKLGKHLESGLFFGAKNHFGLKRTAEKSLKGKNIDI